MRSGDLVVLSQTPSHINGLSKEKVLKWRVLIGECFGIVAAELGVGLRALVSGVRVRGFRPF